MIYLYVFAAWIIISVVFALLLGLFFKALDIKHEELQSVQNPYQTTTKPDFFNPERSNDV